MGSRISKSKKRTTMNSTILTLALLCAGMVLLCNVDQVTGNQPILCSKNYYYTNWDCRNNCRACQYRNCAAGDWSCGADYDDGDQSGEGVNGKNHQGVETKKDAGAGDYSYGGGDYDYGK